MTTPSYAELTAAIRGEGEAIVAAGKLGTQVAVPTCDGWVMRDLLVHVGRVFCRVTQLVSERSMSAAELPKPPPEGTDPVGYLADALDELVAALASAEPDTPVWNWSPLPDEAAFWARRMAHEAAVHRFDAQRAHNVAQPIDADLAPDGIDELIDVIVPRLVADRGAEPPDGVIAFEETDDCSWIFRSSAAGLERLDVAKEPDVTVRGTSSALLLAACNRVPWTSLDTSGDTDLLEAWSAAVKF